MDIADRAQKYEEQHRKAALAAVSQTNGPDNIAGICGDCGYDIEAERLALNRRAVRCIDCQQDHEYLEAARARNGRL